MKRFYILSVLFCGVLISGISGQCPLDNSFNGFPNPLNPAGFGPGNATTSTNTWGGDYVQTNVTIGNSYTWETCVASNYNTQLTLYRDGTSTLLAFNDDFCGVQSSITWVATFTGTTRLLLDQMPGCTHNSLHHPIRVTLNGALNNEVLTLAAFSSEIGNRLEWVIPAEIAVDNILVERSHDGNSFQFLKRLSSANGDISTPYLVDESPYAGENWYRIQVRDANGQVTFSNITQVFNTDYISAKIWPNPSAGRMRLEWAGGEGAIVITVFDLSGREILQLEEDWKQSLYQKHLDISGAGKGTYVVMVRRGNEVKRILVEVVSE